MLSLDDFEGLTDLGDDSSMYSSDIIPYGQGPAFEDDDPAELPIMVCSCKKTLGAIGSAFITRMENRQRQMNRRMTAEEFGTAAGEEMDALDEIKPILLECCMHAIDLEVGAITEEDEPTSRLRSLWMVDRGGNDVSVSKTPVDGAHHFEACKLCRRDLTPWLGIIRANPTMSWDEARQALGFRVRRTLRSCCRTNIIEPIIVNADLERAARIIDGSAGSLEPLEGQRLIEGRTLHDEYRGNITVRRVRKTGEVTPLVLYSPYTQSRAQIQQMFQTDPDTTAADQQLLIVTAPDRPVKSIVLATQTVTHATEPWEELSTLDESLFPSMPEITARFVYQPVIYPSGLLVQEQNLQITGMMRTGLQGYEVLTVTSSYVSR